MKKWQIVVVTLLVLFVFGLLILNRWLRPYDLAKEQARARAVGIPLTPAEFHRPKPPAALDAGPDWEALAADLEKRPLDKTLVADADAAMDRGAKPSAAGDAALRRLLDSRPDVVARVHTIATKPSAYFEHTWSMTDLFPYFPVMRRGAKLLQAESILMARGGRYEDAVRNQALALRIANHNAEDPILISYLVACAVETITYSGLGEIMNEAGPNARVAEAVRAALDRNPSRLDFAYAMKGEALFGITSLRSIPSLAMVNALSGSSPGTTAPPNTKPGPLFRRFFLDPSEAVFLHWLIPVERAAREPAERRVAALARADAEREARLKVRTPANVLPAIMFPVYAKAGLRGVHADARRRVLRAATYVMEYRAKTGRWPARLEDAMLNPPPDPFTLKPLAYKTDAQGFSLTSTAGDDTDKGKPFPPITFRYPGGGL